MKQRILLSADTGIDDCMALAYLLAQSDVQVSAIIATYGNVHASKSAYNNAAILNACKAQIPIALGCTGPSWAREFTVDSGCATFHGSNGLGNVNMPYDSNSLEHVDFTVLPADIQSKFQEYSYAPYSIGGYEPNDEREHYTLEEHRGDFVASQCGIGVQWIIDNVRNYGKELTVLVTGPLTDVDAAMRLAPDIVENIRIVMMGGTLTQEGNCYDLVCETNIIQDPEAAKRVFESGAEITMVGLDVTHQCLLTAHDTQAWRDTQSVLGTSLANMCDFYLHANYVSDEIFTQGAPLHDPLAAAVTCHQELVQCVDMNVTVETRSGDGYGVRGRTIGDRTRLLAQKKNTHVALGVQSHVAHDEIVKSITNFVSQLRGTC
ncbi:MAG: nucleoside hydrolase [Bifidobacteriaceae bacterium]|nr:nucleoside hydrolase [Bifidobacteriaceae bacterium]